MYPTVVHGYEFSFLLVELWYLHIYISRFVVEYFMRVNLHQLHFMMPTFSVLLIYLSKIIIFMDGYFCHMVSFGSFFSSLQEKEQPDVFAHSNCSWRLTNVITASYIPKALRPSSLLSIRIMAADLKWSPLAMMGQKRTKLPFEMLCMFAKLLGKAKEVGGDILVGRAEYCNFHSFICNLAFLIC